MTDGREGGHVESAPGRSVSTADEANALGRATVAVAGSEPCERSGFIARQAAEFRQVSLEHGGNDRADAWDLLQPPGPRVHGGVGFDLLGHGAITLGDLFVEQGEQLLALLAQQPIAVMLGAVDLAGASLDQLGTTVHQLGEVDLCWSRWQRRRGLDRLAESSQHRSVILSVLAR